MSRSERERVLQEARRLADALKPLLRWYDGFSVPEQRDLVGVNTRWGPVSYVGLMKSSKEGDLLLPQRHSYVLMGILKPGSTLDDLYLFPLVIRQVARDLGAQDVSILRDDIELGRARRPISPNERTKQPEVLSLTWRHVQ